MTYYNQRDYPTTPYPSSANPRATIKSGGCGVCSASMALETVTGQCKAPPAMATYAISKGARDSGGTNMAVLLRALRADYPVLTMETTTDFTRLLAHLRAGGYAITSTPGDRPGRTGVFSDAAHIFCVVGIRRDGRMEVLDPNYYAGKYNKAGRRGKVEMDGSVSLCTQATLREEISGRTIYLLAQKEEEKEEEDLNRAETEALCRTLIREALEGKDTEPSSWAAEELEKAKALGLTDGQRPQGYARREEVAAMVLRAKEGAHHEE